MKTTYEREMKRWDWFACFALAGNLAYPHTDKNEDTSTNHAEAAFEIANEMMEMSDKMHGSEEEMEDDFRESEAETKAK